MEQGNNSGHASSGRSQGFRKPSTTSTNRGYRGGFSRGGFSAGRGGFQRNNRGGRGGRSFGQHIDVSRFINKAVTTTEVVQKFVPVNHFKDFKIDERLKKNILKKGYELPTPIQDKAVPHILEGKDVVGIANTGTGKTAAFLIPAINKIILNPKEKIMVIVPTRELAIQIDNELRGFVFGLGIFSACCVGGAPISRQINDLRRKNNFVIGTPGRLKDLVERKCIVLSEFKTIVLDEADRMLDMGFVNDMRFIMSKMQADRHTLFFSATLSKEIEALIGEFLKDPVRISVKTGDTSKNVDQDVVRVRGNKLDVLHDLLKKEGFNKVLIFGKTKHGVERLSVTLAERGFKVESIHGDKNHSRRQKALSMFKDNKIQVLVATDVAARGLDIDGISHVINYDVPATYEDYVHRIGRTGRGDKKGKALTFVD